MNDGDIGAVIYEVIRRSLPHVLDQFSQVIQQHEQGANSISVAELAEQCLLSKSAVRKRIERAGMSPLQTKGVHGTILYPINLALERVFPERSEYVHQKLQIRRQENCRHA